MAENSSIEWTDHTFNPWTGCMKVSPGCDGCYAEAWSKRAGAKVGKWGPGAPRVRTTPANWRKPLAWNAQADAFYAEHGRRQRVFCASLADVFDNEVPAQWRRDLFDLIVSTPHLDWLLLTKRIGNAERMIAEAQGDKPPISKWGAWPLPNVWLGATIVNQEEADRDIPKLLQVQARVRFLSIEPLLGPVEIFSDMTGELLHTSGDEYNPGSIAWVIVGGESGLHARPMHPDWARSLRDQCQAADVPFLFKQWGEWASVSESPVHPEATRLPGNLCRVTRDGITTDHYVAISIDGGRRRYVLNRIGKKAAGRLLDGRTWDEFPEVSHV